MSTWFILDAEGHCEPVIPRGAITWPSFTHLALRHGSEEIWRALGAMVERLGLGCGGGGGHEVRLQEQGAWGVLEEPGVEMEARVIGLGCAEYMAGVLGCDGVFVCHDESMELLQCARFERGQMTLLWEDSTDPQGPQNVVRFDWERGTFEQEDARLWAVRALGGQGGVFDRQGFVQWLIAQAGHGPFEPEGVGEGRALRVVDFHEDDRPQEDECGW